MIRLVSRRSVSNVLCVVQWSVSLSLLLSFVFLSLYDKADAGSCKLVHILMEWEAKKKLKRGNPFQLTLYCV